MSQCLIAVALRYEHDVVLARQRASQIAELLGFEARDQVRIATAVSEIARNAFLYAKRGKVEFWVENGTPASLRIRVADSGPGIIHLQQILDGQYTSHTGMGMGILGARRLMPEFSIESSPQAGTVVSMAKPLPVQVFSTTQELVGKVADHLAKEPPSNTYAEVQRHNQELLSALDELEQRQAELARLNKELEDTNRGVVALYAELDERADYLRRASDLKTQFLSNMTHEFRTPLNSILSLSRILLDRLDGDLTREQEKQVKFIQKAASDLSELVNDLLDLAKVEAGKIAVRPAEFQVDALFGGLRGMLRPLLAHNSSVALQFEEPESMPPLMTDESKVSQILRNLISNALKYTDNGQVVVRARLENQDTVEFSVSDTGVGIAEHDQERIFDEFIQIEGPHQVGKKGTGLGLPLSRKLAELLGGSLSVESKAGAGSTFRVHVPRVYRGALEISTAGELSTEVDPTRLPVLVVEDNREMLFVYDTFFQGTPYQAIPAHTLLQARQALTRFRPVAVILDILLEHESAWSFLTELKGNPATKTIPVLVVTVVENQRNALAMGADAFHLKPVSRDWILEQLERRPEKSDAEELVVIDDDEASRYVLKGLLSNTRYRVTEAGNGEEGLRLVRSSNPSAIFLDLMLPDLSGFEIIRHLRAEDSTRQVPIIIHTGKVLNADERECLAKEAVAIIPKAHIDRAASLKRIREALQQADKQSGSVPNPSAASGADAAGPGTVSSSI